MGGTLSGRKRDRQQCEEDSEETASQSNSHSGVNDVPVNYPKRKKLRTTCEYIYDTLFLGSEGSDLTVQALGRVIPGREWKLHRVYLCQAGYFKSMFSGSWRESEAETIHIEIPDESITEQVLDTAFGSLYSDEVQITYHSAVPLLATAVLLQMDALERKCVEFMLETMSCDTVCLYHAAAQKYGQLQLLSKSLEWLEKCLMSQASVTLLREISVELMRHVITSPGLFVMQIEVDLYNLLKVWAFLKLHPSWSGSWKEVRVAASLFYQSRDPCGHRFLEDSQGEAFVPVFSGVRLWHVINDLRSMQLLDEDRIFPEAWLDKAYRHQWTRMLSFCHAHNSDSTQEMDADQFHEVAFRCGRILDPAEQYCWRWTGFSYGVDVIMAYNPRTRELLIKRNTYTHPSSAAVCLHQECHVLVRVTVACFDEVKPGCGSGHTCSGLLRLALSPDEQKSVLQLDQPPAGSLHVSAYIAVAPIKT